MVQFERTPVRFTLKERISSLMAVANENGKEPTLEDLVSVLDNYKKESVRKEFYNYRKEKELDEVGYRLGKEEREENERVMAALVATGCVIVLWVIYLLTR